MAVRISGAWSSFSIAFTETVWFAASLMEPICCSVSVGIRGCVARAIPAKPAQCLPCSRSQNFGPTALENKKRQLFHAPPVRRKEKKRKEKEKKKKRKRRREKKKRKEREREENAGAARSAAGGQARGACPSRSPRHGQLPAIPIVQRPPGAGVAGSAGHCQWETVRA